MVLKYLIKDKNIKKQVADYCKKNFKSADETAWHIYQFKDADAWVVTIAIDANDKKAAKVLSTLNDVLSSFDMTILRNESSAYYNRTLYPLINEFERKLRELLYCVAALQQNGDSIKALNNLESKDFGKLYEELFTDKEYIESLKTYLGKDVQWIVSKSDLLKKIESIPEETLWMKLLGEGDLLSLQDDFVRIRNYRNDVMHAHNISEQTFNEAKALFKRTNAALEKKIEEFRTGVKITDISVEQFDEIVESTIKRVAKENIDSEVQAMIRSLTKASLFMNMHPELFDKNLDELYKAIDDGSLWNGKNDNGKY